MRAPPPHSSLLHQPRKARSHTAVYFCRGHTADAQEQKALATPARKEPESGGVIRTGPWLGDHPHVQVNVSSQGGSWGPRSPGQPMVTRHGHEGARNGSGPGRPRKGNQPSPDKTTAAGMRPPWEVGHRPTQGVEEGAHGHAQAWWRCSLGASPQGHQEGVTLPALTLHQPWLLLGTGVLIFMLNMHNSACSTCPGHLLLNSSMSA